jgi:hypothetical protein
MGLAQMGDPESMVGSSSDGGLLKKRESVGNTP